MKNKPIVQLFNCSIVNYLLYSPPYKGGVRGGSNETIEQCNNRKSQKGFTIVELILYMSILSVLLSVLSAIFAMAVDVQLESQSTSAVEQDKNFILSRLSYDIARASDINIPAGLGDQENNFQIVIDGVNYTYSIDANNNLVLTNDSGIEKLNSYDSTISGFNVKRLGNAGKVEDTLKISFTIASKTQRVSIGSETRTFETTLALRRK